MSIFEMIPGFRPPQLRADYSVPPPLPRDAERIVRHDPLSQSTLTFSPGDLELKEMPRGWSYAMFQLVHSADGLCDARVLDAFCETITVGGKISKKIIKKFFGNFTGQVFFLGTSFLSQDGRECVPFLNVGLPLPALRYMCPVEHPVNHDVCCCACFFRPSGGKR